LHPGVRRPRDEMDLLNDRGAKMKEAASHPLDLLTAHELRAIVDAARTNLELLPPEIVGIGRRVWSVRSWS
jgi:hypothetical protein